MKAKTEIFATFDSLLRAIVSVPKEKVDKEVRRVITEKKKRAAQKRAITARAR